VIADRVPKKTVIQVVQWFNTGNAVVLALLAWSGHLGYVHLVATAVLAGAVNSVMTAARHTIIQDVVGRDRLMNGISLNVSMQNLMQLVGPGIGGALIAFAGPAITFWVMAACYLGAVVFTMQLPGAPAGGSHSTLDGNRGGFGDLVDGLKYVSGDPVIRTHILINFVIVLLATPYMQMLPGFVKEVLGRGPTEQGVLVAFSGAGALIGSLMLAPYPPHHRGRLQLGIAMMLALALVAFSANTSYRLMLPIMMIIGAGISTRMQVGQVILQTYSVEAYRGRTVAVWMTQYSIVSFGTFAVGILAEQVGPRVAIGGMATALLLFVVAVIIFVPRYRSLQ
jgi:MFS family permease